MVAIHDAEKTCAWLSNSGLVDIVVTDDYDAIAFGSSYVLRNANKKYMECISLDRILLESNFSHDEFVKFCILSGCDFTSKDLKLGMKNAYECVQKREHYKYESQMQHIVAYYAYVPDKVPISAIRSEMSSLIIVVMVLRCLVDTGRSDAKNISSY